jgi:LuxR family transcriptional regulator, maltose regulon positive regulatory protein
VSVRPETSEVAAPTAMAPLRRVRGQQPLSGVLETKLIAPPQRPGTVVRGELLDRLSDPQGSSVVGIFAPAGYGKTTLLAQSVARERRPVAWVSLDEGDNDPVVLLSHVAVAVDRVLPLTPALFAMLTSPGRFEPGAIHRVCSELSALPEHVLVLDDVQLVSEAFSRDAIATLALHVGQGSQIVLSGRSSDGLPIARLRAAGRLTEVGAADLALDAAEARAVLAHARVNIEADDATLILRRTEGWAIAVYLASLSLGASATTNDALTAFSGEDRDVVDYVRSEFLASLAPPDLRFLMATSILDRMCGPLCDAVLQTTGSAQKLEELERSNLNVVPLDRTRTWYRYHHLFRDVLRSELVRREPTSAATLHRRAGAWLEGNGEAVAAVEHVLAGGDVEHAAALIAPLVPLLERSGRGATTRRWLDALGPETLERLPALALAAGWFAALGGDRVEAERWLAAAEGRADKGSAALGAASAASGVALLRAVMCPAGVEQMRADAEFVLVSEPTWSPWRSTATAALGFAHVLAGDDRRAETVLSDGVREARRDDNDTTWSLALSQLALYALERGELGDAARLSREARGRDLPSMRGCISAFALVASARVAQRSGDSRRLAEYVAGVRLLRPQLTAAIPSISVLTLLELARIHIASGDSAGARTVLRDLDDLLRERPNLGIVGDVAKQLAEQVRTLPINIAGATTLTPAELRLVPLLPTHLSFPEIGSRLFLSRHTVKTQAISIYRKLDTSSRGEAVTRARDIGLLDEFVRDTPAALPLRESEPGTPAAAPSSSRLDDARGPLQRSNLRSMRDHEQTLRRLALNDEKLVASMLAQNDGAIGGGCRDPQTLALVRLAALIASTGTSGSYQSVIDDALAAGAPIEDVVSVLIAVAPTIGSARLVAAAPLLARAVGFEVDAAFDRD